MEKQIEEIKNSEDLWSAVKSLQLLASNEKSHGVSELIDKTIGQCRLLDDRKALVNLYGYKIPIIYNFKEKLPLASQLINEMLTISKEIDYQDGIAWAHSYVWYIEKFQGDKMSAKKTMDKSLEIFNQLADCDRYIHHFILYSYAVEKWLEERDSKSADILEECADYFFQNGFYRSLVQTLGILLIIYQRTQNSEKVLETSQGLLENLRVFEKLPKDVQACTHYIVGLGYTLQYSLANAEAHFEKAREIFKDVYKQTIYISNYVLALSYLSMSQALQGKMVQALQLIIQIEFLIQDEFIKEDLEIISKRQIKHSFNLVKFYVQTRKRDFNIEESSELIKNLYSGTQINYSDAIMLSEFLLNAQLSYEQLLELQKKDNPSLKRVKHIMSFMMEKTRTDVELTAVELLRNCIVTLWKRRVPKDDTFVEQSFVDLLLAQQYYDLGRFDEMNKLLRNYSDKLDTIEVLEQRLFIKGMMYFAAHRSGDIFAPSKFYKSIQECKNNDFTRLEELLTSYI